MPRVDPVGYFKKIGEQFSKMKGKGKKDDDKEMKGPKSQKSKESSEMKASKESKGSQAVAQKPVSAGTKKANKLAEKLTEASVKARQKVATVKRGFEKTTSAGQRVSTNVAEMAKKGKADLEEKFNTLDDLYHRIGEKKDLGKEVAKKHMEDDDDRVRHHRPHHRGGNIHMDDIEVAVGDGNEDLNVNVAAKTAGKRHPFPRHAHGHGGGNIHMDDINIEVGEDNQNVEINTAIRSGGKGGNIKLDDINIDIGDNNENVTINVMIGTGFIPDRPIRKLTEAITALTEEVENLSLSNTELSRQNQELAKTISQQTAEEKEIARAQADFNELLTEAVNMNTEQTTILNTSMQEILLRGLFGGGGPGGFGGAGGSKFSKLANADSIVKNITGQMNLSNLQSAGGGAFGRGGGSFSGLTSNMSSLLSGLLDKLTKL